MGEKELKEQEKRREDEGFQRRKRGNNGEGENEIYVVSTCWSPICIYVSANIKMKSIQDLYFI